MQIRIASVTVADQDQALRFYTGVLGFTKHADIPMGGNYRWLTVTSPEGAEQVELALEPLAFPPSRGYQRALFEAGVPATAFVTDDVQAEFLRLKALGVVFRGEPVDLGPIRAVMFEDGCGNLLHLVQPSAEPTDFHSARVFDATPEAIYAAFADPARLARWWGPAGFSNSFDSFDLVPGGRWLFTMHGPDGKSYFNENVFLQVVPGRLLVLQHVLAPVFELRITLADAGAGRTRMAWRMRFADATLRTKLNDIIVPANEQNFDRLQAELQRAPG